MKNTKYKHLSLSLFSFFLILIFINIGANKNFLFSRVMHNWNIMKELQFTDDSTKKVARWGNPYYTSIYVKNVCDANNVKNPVILLEPNGYYKAKNIDFNAPEPIIFYYYTGIKGIWMNSKNIKNATHLMSVDGERLTLEPINDSTELAKIIAFYTPYDVTL